MKQGDKVLVIKNQHDYKCSTFVTVDVKTIDRIDNEHIYLNDCIHELTMTSDNRWNKYNVVAQCVYRLDRGFCGIFYAGPATYWIDIIEKDDAVKFLSSLKNRKRRTYKSWSVKFFMKNKKGFKKIDDYIDYLINTICG